VCGLTGFLDSEASRSDDELRALLDPMTERLRHRGPDDEGAWTDAGAGVALGFRRLSIIDLSEHGHQPMTSQDGRLVLIFNGEIYNYRDLRSELEGLGDRFRGSSDTEVMLEAFGRWGFDETLQRLNGMFALALWDRRKQKLLLARDRMGEKPLYYGWMGRVFLFGSELKALRAHPAFNPSIDRDALALFLRYKYVPTPRSIYRSIAKLTPGASLTIDPLRWGEYPSPREYWSVRAAAEAGLADPLKASDRQATDQLESLLCEAVGMRMHADVPLGAFLSGGVDSSTVVAMMQSQSGRPVKTFTIALSEVGYDESGYARAVAQKLVTDHTELVLTPREAIEAIPRLPTVYDEPFADSSQLPTMLVSELARRSVTVSLSGDGGDELFGGYNRHRLISSLWGRVGKLPRGVRRAASGTLSLVPADMLNRGLSRFPQLARGEAGQRPGDKLQKLAAALAVDGPEEMYLRLVSHWTDPASMVLGATEPITTVTDPGSRVRGLGDAERAMFLDAVTYLPDDILTKVDRASMSVSLEARVPLLDHRVVELAWRVPLSMKIRNGEGKWLLREVLRRYIPEGSFARPKAGFGVPIGDWLRGPLREWAEELLKEPRLRDEGFLDPRPVRRAWQEHLAGRHNHQYPLWDVLMFQSWLDAERGRSIVSEGVRRGS
jgi:asparagine synthase (glutamine-hydrolysing)